MAIPYLFYEQLVMRSPRFPMDLVPSESTLQALPENKLFMEAIYLASPVLHDECIKWKNGQLKQPKDIRKLKASLVKYYMRMNTRCTPFGLFSGCSVASWRDGDTSVKVDDDHIKRRTRLDMHYLCDLAQQLALREEIRQHLLFYPNTSIYTLGDEIRYIEYHYLNGKRIHQITSIETCDVLDKILTHARPGVTIDNLAKTFTSKKVCAAEATDYVRQLVNAQVLVSELEPAVTGEEFIHQVIAVLERIHLNEASAEIGAILGTLRDVLKQLHRLDQSAGTTAGDYRDIAAQLRPLGVPHQENKLFQVDCIFSNSQRGVSTGVRDELYKALSVLNKLSLRRSGETLASFRKRFVARYEDKEMPLLSVLDTETGIGYLESGGEDHAPLVEDLVLPGRTDNDNSIRWGMIEKYLATKLTETLQRGSGVLEINEEELLKAMNNTWDDLPPSMAVMFRLLDDKDSILHLEQAAGSSAVNILGRFAHADTGINDIASSIAHIEQDMEPSVVFAEIIHLPESRTGNVLLHPAFRGYEIPYLGKSSLDPARQIDVSDLMISVRNDRVVLRSIRLNKQVIPRLSNAHNFRSDSLPVYHLLCDLQLQGHREGLAFSWGSLAHQHKYFPRVVTGKSVLSLAGWRLQRADFQPLLAEGNANLVETASALRRTWHLPLCVTLVDGDNELFVDFSNQLILQAFVETIRNRQSIELREFLSPARGITCSTGNKPLCNQFVAPLVKTTSSYQSPESHVICQSQDLTRNFTAGSEWLYYKLYCGVKSGDRILTDAILPLTEELAARKLIKGFFFIRYSDPSFHLRVRFQLNDPQQIGEVIRLIHLYLAGFEQAGYIWKTQIDTYSREIERYGLNTMEASEALFFHESQAVLQMLDHCYGDKREQTRWQWAMTGIDLMLTDFGFDTAKKMSLLETMKNSFANEFNSDSVLKTQLNNKYRIYRSQIEQMMERVPDIKDPVMMAFRAKSGNSAPFIAHILSLDKQNLLQVNLASLLGSYIHMLMNRIIPNRPRVHELVIYDWLYQYYRAKIHKHEKMQTKISNPD